VDDAGRQHRKRSHHQRRNVSFDLIKQVRYFGNIADIIRRQLDRDDFMRDGINSEVQLSLDFSNVSSASGSRIR
jgi:hypothetical protein